MQELQSTNTSNLQIINTFQEFKKDYHDLQILKLINSKTGASKIVFFSVSNNIFIDPVDKKYYKPVKFGVSFRYDKKQHGTINKTTNQIEFAPNPPLKATLKLAPKKTTSLKKVPRKKPQFRLRTDLDTAFKLIEQNREQVIKAMLHFNRERGKISINKDEAEEILNQVISYSRLRGLDPFLVLAVIWQESGFSVRVKNGPNYGLMQINRPAHLKNLINAGITTKEELLKIPENVSFGTAILDECLHRYGLRDGLAAYNAGPGKRKTGKAQNYAVEVMAKYHTFVDVVTR